MKSRFTRYQRQRANSSVNTWPQMLAVSSQRPGRPCLSHTQQPSWTLTGIACPIYSWPKSALMVLFSMRSTSSAWLPATSNFIVWSRLMRWVMQQTWWWSSQTWTVTGWLTWLLMTVHGRALSPITTSTKQMLPPKLTFVRVHKVTLRLLLLVSPTDSSPCLTSH